MTEDTRNVTDEFKNLPHEEIVQRLDARGVELEIAIENLQRDYNMGTIVRSANAFGVRTVHIIGSRQWNKRGAMMTNAYLNVIYHASISDFIESNISKSIIAIDNVVSSKPLQQTDLPRNAILVFGAERPGLSDEMIAASEALVAIEQLGSTRSINVGVAAGIVIYEWLRRHSL